MSTSTTAAEERKERGKEGKLALIGRRRRNDGRSLLEAKKKKKWGKGLGSYFYCPTLQQPITADISQLWKTEKRNKILGGVFFSIHGADERHISVRAC